MIVVKVELHSAITGQVTELGRMHVSNDGTSRDPSYGNYDVKLFRKGTKTIQREGRVEKHARKSLSIWSLLSKALKAVNF